MDRRTLLKSILAGALACVLPWKKARAAAPSDLPASWAEYPVRVDATKLERCHPPLNADATALRSFSVGDVGHYNVRTSTVGRYTQYGERQKHVVLCVLLGNVIAGRTVAVALLGQPVPVRVNFDGLNKLERSLWADPC